LGHTDVVPTGPEEKWSFPPFDAAISDGWLFGRGVADMKGGVAAMAVALERFVRDHPDHPGELGLLITSDEEGAAVDGIARVVETVKKQGIVPDMCLVGEPSSQKALGDTVRIGRRGAINARLTVNGIQGHTAFPENLRNPVHELAPFLAALASTNWDEGDTDFPPTSCQVSNINAGTGATNVTPSHLTLDFNFRNGTASTADALRERVEAMFAEHGLEDYALEWKVMGRPFRSEPGALRAATVGAVRDILEIEPDCNTGGGTSDGRFMAPLGCEVLELGLMNTSIHQIDERTPLRDLDHLTDTYFEILKRLFVS
jgi:succinyl-diaminopimelate desuccinylase